MIEVVVDEMMDVIEEEERKDCEYLEGGFAWDRPRKAFYRDCDQVLVVGVDWMVG